MPANVVASLLLHSLHHGHISGTCPLYDAVHHKGFGSSIATVPNAQDAVREAVFKVLGDLYLVFGGPSLSDGPLAPLHAPPAEAPLRRLWGVCEDILDQQVQVSPGVARVKMQLPPTAVALLLLPLRFPVSSHEEL